MSNSAGSTTKRARSPSQENNGEVKVATDSNSKAEDTSKKPKLDESDSKGEVKGFGFSAYTANPFKNVGNSASSSGFGSFKSSAENGKSSTSGFGSYKENPFLKAATNTKSGFGFGGSTPKTLLSVSPATPGSPGKREVEGVKENKNGNEDDDGNPEAHEPKVIFKPVVPLLEEVEPNNGEDGEKSILQVRAKLFRLTQMAAAPSSITEASKESSDKLGSPEKKDGDGSAAGPKRAAAPAAAQMEWKDVGIGPLKVLVAEAAPRGAGGGRVVMRREVKLGGGGTKVILNVALGPHVSVARQGEREVRLVAPAAPPPPGGQPGAAPAEGAGAGGEAEGGKGNGAGPAAVAVAASYLLRVKLKAEADALVDCLEERRQKGGAAGGGKGGEEEEEEEEEGK